jgi:hypothetical protein
MEKAVDSRNSRPSNNERITGPLEISGVSVNTQCCKRSSVSMARRPQFASQQHKSTDESHRTNRPQSGTPTSQRRNKFTATKHNSETGPSNTVSIPQDCLTDKLHATDNVRENRAAAVRQTDGRTDGHSSMHQDWK